MTTTTRSAMAHPLHWPAGRARTPRQHRRRNSLWNGSTASTAMVEIEREVERMGGIDLVVSTNLAVRIDGFPRSGQPEPEDVGVAVYFERKGKRLAFACDKWTSVRENLRAIGMHLEAIRGQERWGVGSLDQAFAGYAALPETSSATDRPWWEVFGMDWGGVGVLRSKSGEVQSRFLRDCYRELAKLRHPDCGGSNEAFAELQKAYEAAKLELGVA
jgi:hypothetical protein